MKILIAEDDERLLKSLTHIFKVNNYLVDGVNNGTDAYHYAKTGEYDGIILDIMMPCEDGVSVLKRLREEGVTVPVLFLTARSEVYQRVEGLDAGADDYISKPFSTAELLARVRAMLRRKDNFVPDLVNFGSLTLNRSTYELCSGENTVSLSAKEYQVMEMLVSGRGAVVSTEQFITHVWGWDADIDVGAIWVHISNIRKKIDSIGSTARIRYIRNAGYVLEDSNDI